MELALDILSTLPNSLLFLILSKLPIRDAIKCSVLSKHWRYLYTEIPDLILSPYRVTTASHRPPPKGNLSWSTVENRIFDILRLHSSNLRSFILSTDIDGPWGYYPDLRFTRQSISEWLQCVARKNVERLSLKYSYYMETPPPALFSCSRLTMLTLYNCSLPTFPTDFAGFNHLTDCTLDRIRMTDDSVARFLLHCPLLQKFKLLLCFGLQMPVMSALNLTDLVVHLVHTEVLAVNCRKLKTLKTVLCLKDLRVNGMAFYELSSTIRGLEMEAGSNLIELSLHSRSYPAHYSSLNRYGYNFSVNRFLELVGTLRSLKVLAIDLSYAFDEKKRIVVPMFNLLSRLPNLERLHLRGQLILAEPEGDSMRPSLTNTLANLQFVEIEMSRSDARELGLLDCLLQIAPALKLKFQPARHPKRYKSFSENSESLKKRLEQGKITEKICEIGFLF